VPPVIKTLWPDKGKFAEEYVMRIKVIKNTLLCIILFGASNLNAQKAFDLEVKDTSLNLDGKSVVGYLTEFDFTREEVRKGWWKYARQFGSPLDMRTYYLVKISSETTDGNVDLSIYSQALEEGGKAFFKLGVEEEKYKVQVEELIKVFKKDFYIKFYLAELSLKEVEAEKYSGQFASAVLGEEKSEALNALNLLREEIEWLKEEIRKVEEQD
jgi:hypothetical protein